VVRAYYVCSVYLPPNCDTVLYEMHMSSVESLFENCDVNDNFLICGDYNLPDINWDMDLSDGTLIPSCVTSIKETLVIDSMSVLDLTQVNSIPNSRNVYLDLFFCNFTDDISILNCECPLLKLDVHHAAYEINISFDDVIFDSTQEFAKRYNFREADVPSILNYLNDANWVDIFGTSDANTCVSLFYEKLERSFELFVPVFRSPARPMTHPW
jgi:hypothetical protein